MNTVLKPGNIPGTVFRKEKMGGVTGGDFLDKVFYITDHIMLAQIREITGIDGTTLQNWLKRGWVPNPIKKSYGREHLSRILIINMMRDTMQLSRIMYLLTYLNGAEPGDAIVSESTLYDSLCRVLEMVFDKNSAGINGLDHMIETVLMDYEEPCAGAKRRLTHGISIMVMAYFASIVKARADDQLDDLGADKTHRR